MRYGAKENTHTKGTGCAENSALKRSTVGRTYPSSRLSSIGLIYICGTRRLRDPPCKSPPHGRSTVVKVRGEGILRCRWPFPHEMVCRIICASGSGAKRLSATKRPGFPRTWLRPHRRAESSILSRLGYIRALFSREGYAFFLPLSLGSSSSNCSLSLRKKSTLSCPTPMHAPMLSISSLRLYEA
jgi:hypothetical protein